MSHFFTKDKQSQLATLSGHIDLDALAAAGEGTVLKANADGVFVPGSDETGGLPDGAEGQVLSWSGDAPTWIDAPPALPAVGADGQVMMVVGGAWASSDPSSILPVPGADGEVLTASAGAWASAASPAIPESISDLLSEAPMGGDKALMFDGEEWYAAFFPEAGTENVGKIPMVKEISVEEDDGSTTSSYFWDVASLPAGADLPDGDSDGDLLVWRQHDRTGEYATAFDTPVEYVGNGGFKVSVEWDGDEAGWLEFGNPIHIILEQDSDRPDDSILTEWDPDTGVLKLKAKWQSVADIDNDLKDAINDSGAGAYIAATGVATISASQLGFVVMMDSIANGEQVTNVLLGPKGWFPSAPAPLPSNKLCDASQIVRWSEADLTVDGDQDVLEGDANMVVLILDEWAVTGTAALRLKDPVVGRHIFINNNSDVDEPDRVINIKCGDGSGGGSINGLDNVDYEMTPRGTAHLLCVGDSTADGEWVIL